MPSDRPLAQNVCWTIGGNAAYALSQWAVLIAVARTTNPESVGKLAYAIAVVAPAIAFASLQLRSVMVTNAGRRFDFAEFLLLRALLLAVALLGLTAYCALARLDAATRWTMAGIASTATGA